METSPAAASSSSKNCISVSSSAGSGMLLMNAILTHSIPDSWPSIDDTRRRFLRSAQRSGTRPPSIINGITSPTIGANLQSSRALFSGLVERLGQIGENIVDMLDPHTKAYHLRCNSHLRLLLWRKLPMRSRCRVTRQRLGIPHIHHPLEQAKRVEALPASLVTAFHSKRQQ